MKTEGLTNGQIMRANWNRMSWLTHHRTKENEWEISFRGKIQNGFSLSSSNEEKNEWIELAKETLENLPEPNYKGYAWR